MKESKYKSYWMKKDSHFHLLVIVCEKGDSDDSDQFESLEKMFSNGKETEKGKRTVIIIGGNRGRMVDAISFGNLSDKSQTKLLDKRVSFQGKDVAVRDLVQNRTHEVIIDSLSINELLTKDNIIIPSFNTSRFEKSLYIKREFKISFPADADNFWSELSEKLECSVEDVQKEFQSIQQVTLSGI